MKNSMVQSFRQQIAISTILSSIITFLFETVFFFVFKLITDSMRDAGMRGAMMDRNGFDPKFRMLLMILLGIAVFILCFWLSLRNSMKYLEEISEGIQNIAEGDLNTPIPVKGNDEFAKIALNLNVMTEEIKILMARERASETTKNDLITSVAHDLRTPLTSIIGYLDLLRSRSDLSDETKNNFLDIAYNKSKRLEKLTNDLFGYAKLNHEQISMKPVTLDIVKLLGQLLDEFYPSFQEKNLECEYSYSHESILLEADGNLLARLFDNLINNAIKYGADGKVVRVILRKTEEDIEIRVVNYGRVIPEHELDNIFEKFYRVDPSRSPETGGTGLGLAIAKSIVAMHGGRIEARSGLQGTVFEVHLQTRLTNHFADMTDKQEA